MESVHFRKATADDYDGVVSLREHLYHGMDYLPSQYHHLLANHTGFCGYADNQMIYMADVDDEAEDACPSGIPGLSLLLHENNGTIALSPTLFFSKESFEAHKTKINILQYVSFMFAALIDDEETIVIRASRVKKEYEKRGIYTKMREYCLHNFPETVIRESFSLFSPDHRDSAILKGGNLAWQRAKITLSTESMAIQTLLQSVTPPDSLTMVDARSLAELFSSPEATNHLFPENFIVVNSVPYKVRASNIPHFLTTDRSMYGSYPSHNEQPHVSVPALVTVANKYRCEAGTRFNVDFYGDVCGEENVADHIVTQMARHLSESDDEVVMYVTFPMHKNDDVLLNVLERLSWRVKLEGFQYGIEHPAPS